MSTSQWPAISQLESLPKATITAQLDSSSSEERYENALAHLTWRAELSKCGRDSGEAAVYQLLELSKLQEMFRGRARWLNGRIEKIHPIDLRISSYYSPRSTLAIGPASFSNPIHCYLYGQALFALSQLCDSVPWHREHGLEGILRMRFGTHAEFEGKYAGSMALPTLQVRYQHQPYNYLRCNIYSPRLVFFIGHSERYETFLRQAKLWLLGTSTVSHFILVYLVESPAYVCPLSGQLPQHFAGPGFSAREQTDTGHLKVKVNETRPVGDFGGSFTEVWGRDPIGACIDCKGRWPMYAEDGTAQGLSMSLSLAELMPEIETITSEADRQIARNRRFTLHMPLMEGEDGSLLKSLASSRAKRVSDFATILKEEKNAVVV
ncbi:MAG: hypothetical protein M1829_000326 [Trizodia sp. TS-e1964]|nr:MAG: hypothetical protein M1829_000326 [Trizodia sp. TS-e1964]